MRHVWLGALLMVGCRATSSTTPEPSTPPAPPPAEIDIIAEVDAMLEAAEIDDTYLRDRQLEELRAAGMTNELATAALAILAERCEDVRTPTCGHVGRDEVMREALVRWLDEHGDLSSAPVLLRLDHYGDYGASRAIESMLTRRMQDSLSPCSPPSDEKVAAARAELSSFVVIEQHGSQLRGRAATARELDDLAYFMAATADNGIGVGEQTDQARSGHDPTPTQALDRTHALAALTHAQDTGDHASIVQAGSDYLHTLGYPGSIDLSREADMFWGGARFSYVMRDVALSAEIEEKSQLAASLYRRANPGGGACGTSVAYRAEVQTRGLIRAEESEGRCEAVVIERLTHGDPDDAYGPRRLAEAGYDVERLYRGALVTRLRDRHHDEIDELAAAIERAPKSVRDAGIVRLRTMGPEGWESKMWAVERLVAMTGRAGMEQMLGLIEHADPELRERLISSIGEAGERGYLGTCDPDRIGLTLRGRSGGPPAIRAFGDGCSTWLTDVEADAIAQRLMPYLRDETPAVRAITARALGYLAAPSARDPLTRVAARADKDRRRCKSRDDDECWRFRDIHDEATEALATMDGYVHDQSRDPFEDEDEDETESQARNSPVPASPADAPPPLQRMTEDTVPARG